MPTPPTTGFAQGGTVTMGDGAMLPRVVPGTRKIATLVGEGEWNGDEEVQVVDPDAGTVEIIPLSGGAQAGQTVSFDNTSLLPAINSLYSAAGRRTPPTTERTYRNATGLGIRPTLVESEGRTYMRDPYTGQYRWLSPSQFAQINERDRSLRVTAQPGEVEGLGGYVPGALPQIAPLPPAYGAYSQPIALPESLGGQMLPDPRIVARALRQWEVTQPVLFNLALSAYEQAGFPREQVLSIMDATALRASGRGVGMPNLVGIR